MFACVHTLTLCTNRRPAVQDLLKQAMVAHARLRDSQRLGSSTADPGEISLALDKSGNQGTDHDAADEAVRSNLDKINTNRTWMNYGPVEPSEQFAQVRDAAT